MQRPIPPPPNTTPTHTHTCKRARAAAITCPMPPPQHSKPLPSLALASLERLALCAVEEDEHVLAGHRLLRHRQHHPVLALRHHLQRRAATRARPGKQAKPTSSTRAQQCTVAAAGGIGSLASLRICQGRTWQCSQPTRTNCPARACMHVGCACGGRSPRAGPCWPPPPRPWPRRAPWPWRPWPAPARPPWPWPWRPWRPRLRRARARPRRARWPPPAPWCSWRQRRAPRGPLRTRRRPRPACMGACRRCVAGLSMQAGMHAWRCLWQAAVVDARRAGGSRPARGFSCCGPGPGPGRPAPASACRREPLHGTAWHGTATL